MELSDEELDQRLREWKAPSAPAHLRAAVFPSRSWWRTSILIPVPVACCLFVLLCAALFAAFRKETVRVEYRDSGLSQKVEWRPVTELRPRIIRRNHATN